MLAIKQRLRIANLAILVAATLLSIGKAFADQQVTAAIGSNLTIAVFADNTTPFTYAWSKGGVPISGATSSTYTITGAQLSDTGNYTAVVTNYLGSTTSDTAIITIGTAPSISVQPPASQTVTAGATVTFTVQASGTPSPTYQWQKGGVNLTDGGIVSGSTTDTLVLTGVGLSDAGTYTVIVSNGIAPAATSNNSSLTVNGTMPAITLQPQGQVVGAGSTVTFTTLASGVPAPTYQWSLNGTAISGATGASLTLSNVTAANNGSYTVVATNIVGSSPTSSPATLTVSPLAPSITNSGAGLSDPVGDSYTYDVVASNSPTSYSATGLPPGLTINAATGVISGTPTTAGIYNVTVTAQNSTGTGNTQLTLTINLAPPVITSAANASGVINKPFSYSITATNSPASFAASNLPAGLSVNTSTGAITGTPTATGVYSIPISATNPSGTTQGNLTLTVLSVSYAGQYFGTFGSGGNWALNINSDNSGEFIAFFGGAPTVQDVSVNANGTIVVSNSGVESISGKLHANATTSVPITINIVNGSVSGTAGADTLSGAQDTGSSLQVSPGFYQGTALNGGTGNIYAVAGGDGAIFEVLSGGSTPDFLTGYMSASGVYNGSTSAGSAVQVQITGQGEILETLSTSGSTTPEHFLGLESNIASTARLINISCRAQVGTGANIIIAGFVVGGAGTSGAESVLVRGSGPALGLAPFNVPGVLPDPELTLENVSNSPNTVVTTDTGWGGSTSIANAAAAVGAFSWGSNATADSAVLASLAPDNYTAEISGASNDAGVALVEVYDATPASSYTPASPRLINLSARVQAGTGSNGVFAGFVIGGTGPETVLIRASGPSLALAPFNLTGTLADPQLTLTNVGVTPNVVIATNTGWGGASAIANAASTVGAFPWSTSSKDSAIVVTLQPGNYTAGVQGASGDTGITLVEVYEVQ